MTCIPHGDWAINCILINETTVMNDDAIRGLEISESEWVLKPIGQRFKVVQSTSNSAVLESKGETYYADFQASGGSLVLQMSRPNFKERIRIEAVAVTADVFV